MWSDGVWEGCLIRTCYICLNCIPVLYCRILDRYVSSIHQTLFELGARLDQPPPDPSLSICGFMISIHIGPNNDENNHNDK
ncbi:hypothetical protein BJX96DRAFT_64803 [Aspergillus floccosus]